MSLFQIEIASKKLQNVLKIPASPKYKILSLINFFKLILEEPDQSIYHSYYKEFIPHLFKLMNQFAQADRDVCFSPEEFDEIENVLIRTKEIITHEYRDYDFEHIRSILKDEKAKALSYLDREERDIPGEEEYSTDSINIVLIEKNLDENNSSGLEVGMIHRFNLSSSRRSRSETVDNVEFNNLIDLDKTKIVEQLNQVTTIAKRACSKENIKTHYYNFTYFFDLKEYIYTGSSLGLGGVVLAYNSILINELCKHYCKFRNDAVFTAEIDKDGNLVKLDEKSLKLKLRAVFFSPYKKFVIPEENINEANSELELFNKKYTKRELQLIPIKSFENVFKNLDIVERCELKFKDKIIANYRRYHTAVNWVLSITTLCVVAFFIINYLIPVLDRNPVYSKFENNKFYAYNKYNKLVWESDFEADYRDISDSERDFFHKNLIQIKDLDNDGENEILVLNNRFDNHMNRRSIFCYNSDNTIEWKFVNPPEDIRYNDNLYEDKYSLQIIKAFDFDNDGFWEIISSGVISPWFPCKVALHDHMGNEMKKYWNAGHVCNINIFDIDNDGKAEIYCSGVSNNSDYWCGVLIIFHPDFIEGASFYTDPTGDGKVGLEKYHILFPKTLLTQFTYGGQNDVKRVFYMGNNRIMVEVSDGEGYASEIRKPVVLYEFDKDMRILNVGLNSQFDVQYKKFIDEKKIEPVKDFDAYLDSLKKSVLYWDGDKFVNYPAMNKHYLAAKDSVERIKNILH